MPTPTPRRRLYLMRHGSVDYFLDDGTPVPPDTVPLNTTGRAQADAAGALFAVSNVRFDRVLVSGLPRTVETAQRVLDTIEGHRFLGGESVGELLDRCLPAWTRFLARDDWDCALLVLHGGVNRALLSSALAGTRAFFGRMEQAPACINVLDIGADHAVVRAMNLSPSQWLNDRERQTTMEKLLAQYLRTGPGPESTPA
jgi:broad specificity phosphatase PhoE